MSSGVKVSDESKSLFEKLLGRKKDTPYRYVIFTIDDGFVQVNKTGARDCGYTEFFDELKELTTQCRYLLFDYPEVVGGVVPEGMAPEGAKTSIIDRLLLFSWCPEGSSVKAKMMYSSSLDAVKRCFSGYYGFIQATGLDEVDEAVILDILKGKKR